MSPRDTLFTGRGSFTHGPWGRDVGRVGVSCCLWSGLAACRLFCNEIYNYNCKLSLSSGSVSRSYGISINYHFNLIPMSTVHTIDHMIDNGSRQGYESYNKAGLEKP